mgnify:CR=1 FL=1
MKMRNSELKSSSAGIFSAIKNYLSRSRLGELLVIGSVFFGAIFGHLHGSTGHGLEEPQRVRVIAGKHVFGLLEMSRQRLRPSISESINRVCSHCDGTGYVRSDATVAISIIRSLEKEVGQAVIEKFRIFLTPSVAAYLLNHMREKLSKIEADNESSIEVQIDNALHDGEYRIEKIKNKEKTKTPSKPKCQPLYITFFKRKKR